MICSVARSAGTGEAVFIQLIERDSWHALPEATWWELPLLIGRGADVDLRIVDRWISRRQCVLEEADGGVVVRDLGSSNGTLVNRQPVRESRLVAGDRLTVGMTTFEVGLTRDVPGEPVLLPGLVAGLSG